MKVYFIYVNKKNVSGTMYNTIISYTEMTESGNTYLLYAIARNKKTRDKFLANRRGDYIVRKKIIKKSDLQRCFSMYELMEYTYHNYAYSLPILSTSYEYTLCHMDWIPLILDDITTMNALLISPNILETTSIFKKQYEDALIKLGMHTLFISLFPDEDESAYFGMVEHSDDLSEIHTHVESPIGIEYDFNLKGKEINLFTTYCAFVKSDE